jgi:hypothetical protein
MPGPHLACHHLERLCRAPSAAHRFFIEVRVGRVVSVTADTRQGHAYGLVRDDDGWFARCRVLVTRFLFAC